MSAVCPQCGSDQVEQTCMGFFGQENPNKARCHSCNWKGKVVDMTQSHNERRKKIESERREAEEEFRAQQEAQQEFLADLAELNEKHGIEMCAFVGTTGQRFIHTWPEDTPMALTLANYLLHRLQQVSFDQP